MLFMAADTEDWMVGSIFPAFIALSLFAVTTCFLALCILCQRKNRIPVQDGELLAGAALLGQAELSSLQGSVTNLQKLNRTNSRAKNPNLASITIPCEDDGTVSSCSFIVFPQRELPQPPSEDLLSLDQTYSNLTFPKRSQEVVYESVPVKGDEEDEPCPVPKEAVAGPTKDHKAADEYAKVQKGKKKKNAAEPEMRTQRLTQETGPVAMALTTPAVMVEEMYAVVCKDKKKKAKNGVVVPGKTKGPQVEMSQGNCHVGSDAQECDRGAGHQSSLVQPYVIEPCYESISCESSMNVGKKDAEEPAYETVDTHWKKSRKKEKSKNNTMAENLYESIANLPFQP